MNRFQMSSICFAQLRESAGNDNLLKLVFLHLFFASKIYNKAFNAIIAIGYCAFFEIHASNRPPI